MCPSLVCGRVWALLAESWAPAVSQSIHLLGYATGPCALLLGKGLPVASCLQLLPPELHLQMALQLPPSCQHWMDSLTLPRPRMWSLCSGVQKQKKLSKLLKGALAFTLALGLPDYSKAFWTIFAWKDGLIELVKSLLKTYIHIAALSLITQLNWML